MQLSIESNRGPINLVLSVASLGCLSFNELWRSDELLPLVMTTPPADSSQLRNAESRTEQFFLLRSTIWLEVDDARKTHS